MNPPHIPSDRADDLHGLLPHADAAELVLFMAGNQFMAMPGTAERLPNRPFPLPGRRGHIPTACFSGQAVENRWERKRNMNRLPVFVGLAALLLSPFFANPVFADTRMEIPMTIDLPSPTFESGVSVEEALTRRRSLRRFADAPLTLAEAGQLLWAAQGVTHSAGYRTAPSAGALYPLELFLVAGAVTDLPPGTYRYLPREHDLVRVREGDQRPALTAGALGQGMLGKAPATLVFCAVYDRITAKYDERGVRYAHMEAGHAAQNVHLQAVALGLGSVPVGAFREDDVRSAIGAEADEAPVYLAPVGRKD